MYGVKTVALIASLMLLFTMTVCAQSLKKRHRLELRLGMWNQTADTQVKVGPSGVATSFGSNGLAVGLAYNHWLSEGLALVISVGTMSASFDTRVGVGGVSTKTAVVVPVLFGLKAYFPKSTFLSSTRPYASVSVGLFAGSQSEVTAGDVIAVQAISERAFGGCLGAGVDFVLSRNFMLGLELGYNLMSDFDEPIGGSDNYSGPEFGVGFGWLFGQGVG